MEAERLNVELESLVMDNYRVFVENLTCSVHLRNDDKKLGEIATELSQELHDLASQCTSFREKVQTFTTSYKRNRKTLQHHMQLVELLEVPQLVDACARNGFHDEALELANFVNGLERRHLLASEVRSVEGKHRGGSDVVQNIVDDVQSTLLGLRQQLLLLLTEQSSLPKEIQILATLRKLDSLLVDRQLALERHDNESLAHLDDKNREILRSHILKCAETRLQMDFLEARTVWLEKITDKALNGGLGAAAALEQSIEGYTAPTSTDGGLSTAKATSTGTIGILGPYGKVIEMLEVNRTSWFSVVTQFNALFQDSAKQATGAHPPSSILSAWIVRQTAKLLHDLQLLLPGIEDGASLRSVLEQALFFATRMGQVGCDFTSLMMPMFCKHLTDRLSDDWDNTMGHFRIMINNERFVLESVEYSREQIIPLYLRQELNDADEQASSSPMPTRRSGQEDVPAPASLLAFPPLTYLLNSFLSAFNLLRECPIARIRDEVVGKIAMVLDESCVYLVQHSESINSRGAKYLSDKAKVKGSNEVDNKLNEMYAVKVMTELIPHILVCLEHVFPSGKASGKKGKMILLKIIDPTSQTSHIALKDCLNPDLCDIFHSCLAIFTNAKLLKVSSELSDGSDQTSKLKSTENE